LGKKTSNFDGGISASTASNRLNLALVIVAWAMLVGGVCGVMLGVAPFGWVQPWLDSMSVRGNAHVSASQWSHVARLVIYPAVICLLLGLAGLANRARLAVFALRAEKRLANDARSLWVELKRGIAADGMATMVLIAAITAAGFGARVYYINQPIRHDEAWTFLVFSLKPAIAAWSSNYEPNNHILNTLLVRLCHLVFGDAEWSLRLPALVAGTLLIPATYLGLRRLVRREAAIVAAAIVASNSFLIEYGALARGYSLVCLATVLAVGLAASVRRQRNLFAWCALCLVMVTGFFAVPIMLYPFAGIAVWLALAAVMGTIGYARKAFMRDLAVFCTVTGVLTLWLYLPVFIVSGVAVDVAKDLTGSAQTPGWAEQLASRSQSFWGLVNRDVPVGLEIVLGVFALGGIAGSVRNWRVRPPLLLVMVMTALALTVVQHMVGYDRIWTYLIPFYAAAVGCTVAWLARRLAQPMRLPVAATTAAGLCAVLVVMGIRSKSILYSDEGGAFPQAKEMAAALVQVTDKNSLVYAKCPLEFPVEYYLRRLGNPLHVNPGPGHGTVFYVDAPRSSAYEGAALRQWLEQSLAAPGLNVSGTIVSQYGPATLHRVDLPLVSDATLAAERAGR
jgi:4-amino-4-deoxy-L-arabinose transferase-like glycosyltransferase